MERTKTTRIKNVLTVVMTMLVCGFFAPVSAPAQTNEENLISVGASIAPGKVSPGAEAVLNLKLNLATGAHANSNQTADPNLIPTVFLPKPQTGFAWGQPKYPKTTEVIEWYSTEPLSVFENGAVIAVPLTIDKTAMPGRLAVEGSLRIQICDSEKCYPVRRIPVNVSLTVVTEENTKTTYSGAKAAEKTNSDNSIAKTDAAADEQPDDASGLDFAFVDFNGKERQFREFRGKFVLLDFWATWCKPCLADIPKLKELYAKFKDKNFEIIGMDAETIGDEAEEPDPEFARETHERAKQIVATRGVTWTQAASATAVPIAMKIFGVKSLPTKILISPEGKIIATISEKDDLAGIIEKRLSEKK